MSYQKRGENKTMKNVKKKKICFMVTVLAFLLMMSPISLQAASKSKKAKAAYGKFLKQHRDEYQWFKILNIGSKKEPILLVTDSLGESKNTSYGKLYYFTGSKVKAVKGGEVSSSGTAYPLQYVNNSLFIGTRWGLGSMIRVNKDYVYGTAVYSKYDDGEVENYYKASIKKDKLYNKKVISKRTYQSYEKKWKQHNVKKNQIISMNRNTSSNRRKYTGVK